MTEKEKAEVLIFIFYLTNLICPEAHALATSEASSAEERAYTYACSRVPKIQWLPLVTHDTQNRCMYTSYHSLLYGLWSPSS